MKTLNLGILAHVDAGKTSLTERLLFNAGVIKTLGSVDSGNTQTDSMALEQKRGITIKSAVVSFSIDDLKINLIDTPGHPDFIAEVERALSVLDAVILVVSAVEGVQPQTRVLMRTLKRMNIPTIIFVNKIDRMGARETELVADIQSKLSLNIMAMNKVTHLGNREARVVSIKSILPTGVIPVFFGSAMTGVGVPELTSTLGTFFTPTLSVPTAIQSGVVFKINRGQRGEKIAYIRLYTGGLRVRHTVTLCRGSETSISAKITTMQIFQNGQTIDTKTAQAGDIVKVWGLTDCQIGDAIGRQPKHTPDTSFARPSLEVVITTKHPDDKQKLHTALAQLSEQDPLIHVYQNESDGALSVHLYGEVQKEVIQDTLNSEFGIEVEFQHTTTICIERPIGIGEAVEIKSKVSKSYLEWDGISNPFLATIGLRIEPGLVDSGVQFQFGSGVLGRMPSAFYKAIEETIPEALQQGLHGWQVTDCIITLTHVEYYPRQSTAHGGFDKNITSTARDFRYLTPLVLMNALKQAGTVVHEPLNRFELDIPNGVLSQVLQRLAEAEAKLDEITTNEAASHLVGSLPVRRTLEFEQNIPDLTQGEGTFTTKFGGYQKVQGVILIKPRGDNNPLERVDYFRRTLKRV